MPVPINYPITFLPTTNLEQTRIFYEKTLNLSIALDQDTSIIFSVGKYGYLGFCAQSKDGLSDPEKVVLTLVVDNKREVDEWHEYLVLSKVRVKRAPQYSADYMIYNGFYFDPMGYTIEIQAFDTNSQPIGAEFFSK